MSTAASEGGYTIVDLVRDAEAQGTAVTRRLVTDWVSLGLLDKANKRGLGRGLGSVATWSKEQRDLFLAMLRKRGEVHSVMPLCLLPVGVWLIWGDEYVPLRQARRALRTWSRFNRPRSKRSNRKLAREFVDRIAHPDAGPVLRGRLIDVLAEVSPDGSLDRDALRAAAKPVLDPHRTGRPRGPAGAQIDADSVVVLLETRIEGILHLDEISDELFEWARYLYRVTRAEWASEIQPRLATDPEIGNLAEEPTLQEVFEHACLNLVGLLGLILMSIRQTDTPRGAFFDPRRSPLAPQFEALKGATFT